MLKQMEQELFDNLKYYNDFPVKGIKFIDIMPLVTIPHLRIKLKALLELSVPKDTDVIIAPESRGFILSYLLSDKNLPIIPVRKAGKLPGNLYSYTYNTEYSSDTLEIQQIDLTNKNVYVIDDIYANGGTFDAIKKLVEKCGGIFMGGTVLLNIFDKVNPDYKINELFSEVKNNEK